VIQSKKKAELTTKEALEKEIEKLEIISAPSTQEDSSTTSQVVGNQATTAAALIAVKVSPPP
jgi:hypothetical protein